MVTISFFIPKAPGRPQAGNGRPDVIFGIDGSDWNAEAWKGGCRWTVRRLLLLSWGETAVA